MEYLFSPSMNVGGDFCDFIQIDEDKFAVIFADISGHEYRLHIIIIYA